MTWDVLLFIGGAIITTGLALIHPPSAVIFAGAAIVAIAATGAWIQVRKRPKPPDDDETKTDTDAQR